MPNVVLISAKQYSKVIRVQLHYLTYHPSQVYHPQLSLPSQLSSFSDTSGLVYMITEQEATWADAFIDEGLEDVRDVPTTSEPTKGYSVG